VLPTIDLILMSPSANMGLKFLLTNHFSSFIFAQAFFGAIPTICNTPMPIKLRANSHHQVCDVQYVCLAKCLLFDRTQYFAIQ